MSESHVRYLHIATFVVSLTDSVEEAFNPLPFNPWSDTLFSIHSLEIVKANYHNIIVILLDALSACAVQ